MWSLNKSEVYSILERIARLQKYANTLLLDDQRYCRPPAVSFCSDIVFKRSPSRHNSRATGKYNHFHRLKLPTLANKHSE